MIDDAHTYEARTTCKHKVARHLMQRYTEALGVTEAEGKRVVDPAPMGWSASGEQTAMGWKARDEEPAPPAPKMQWGTDVFRGQPRGVARKQRWDWRREF